MDNAKVIEEANKAWGIINEALDKLAHGDSATVSQLRRYVIDQLAADNTADAVRLLNQKP